MRPEHQLRDQLQTTLHHVAARGRHGTENTWPRCVVQCAMRCAMQWPWLGLLVLPSARSPGLARGGGRLLKVTTQCVSPPKKNCAGWRGGAGKANRGAIAPAWRSRQAGDREGRGGAPCGHCTHLLWVRHHKGHEGIHGHHPRGDGGAKTLAQERSERHVLPPLNVSGCEGGGGPGRADPGGSRPRLQAPSPPDPGGQRCPAQPPPTRPQPGCPGPRATSLRCPGQRVLWGSLCQNDPVKELDAPRHWLPPARAPRGEGRFRSWAAELDGKRSSATHRDLPVPQCLICEMGITSPGGPAHGAPWLSVDL